jgi:hypothetical protein
MTRRTGVIWSTSCMSVALWVCTSRDRVIGLDGYVGFPLDCWDQNRLSLSGPLWMIDAWLWPMAAGGRRSTSPLRRGKAFHCAALAQGVASGPIA